MAGKRSFIKPLRSSVVDQPDPTKVKATGDKVSTAAVAKGVQPATPKAAAVHKQPRKRKPYENEGRYTLPAGDQAAFADKTAVEAVISSLVPPHLARRQGK